MNVEPKLVNLHDLRKGLFFALISVKISGLNLESKWDE